MSKAIVGDPGCDRDAEALFSGAREFLASAVNNVLGRQEVLRNLGQDALDTIETHLRQSRIEIDRGLVVFARRRTIRTRQGIGGAAGPLRARLEELAAVSEKAKVTSVVETGEDHLTAGLSQPFVDADDELQADAASGEVSGD